MTSKSVQTLNSAYGCLVFVFIITKEQTIVQINQWSVGDGPLGIAFLKFSVARVGSPCYGSQLWTSTH